MNRTWLRVLSALMLISASALHLSCNVNEYCLNCGKPGDGGADDSLDGNDGGGDDSGDGGDGGNCVNTGPEVCDGKDNDCNGQIDEGTLPQVGTPCANTMGECAGGVKQCTNGVITCTKPPMPEICDLKDNDCNGIPDDGDPGGGAVCGTSVGECIAGTNHCVSGTIQCVGSVGTVGGQTEICNNRDDDCDGMFDEQIGVIAPCATGTNVGECNIGNMMCIGGTPTCVGAQGPQQELCDNLDQDCDGNNTNGFDFNTDPQNCGACGAVCDLSALHGFAGCAKIGVNPPMCTVAACQTDYHDNNGMYVDGCEFGPCTISGAEVCDGMDNDCNPATDEATLTPPANLCLNVGECFNAHTSACTGGAFKCTYTDPDVSQAGGVIVPETLCDGKDNDCDGRIDEGQPNLGLACNNGMTGDCRSTGTMQCDSLNLNGPAVCVYTVVGPGMSAFETCDGRDNNCNGQTDEGANSGNLVGQDWINVPNTSMLSGAGDSFGQVGTTTTLTDAAGLFLPAHVGHAITIAGATTAANNGTFPILTQTATTVTFTNAAGVAEAYAGTWTIPLQMMKYEASRPDSGAVVPGTDQTFACSKLGVQPWTNVNYPTAVAACTSVGARLCSEAEWQQMCEPPVTYPVIGPATTGTTDFVFIEAEDAIANTAVSGPTHAWTKIAPPSFNGITAMQVPDLGFSQLVAASALAQSSRLDYQLTLMNATNYRVWMRMRTPAPTTAGAIGTPTAATATLAPTSAAATAIGDLVIVTTWSPTTTNGAPTHTLQAGFTQIISAAHDDTNDDGRLSVAYKVATAAGAQTYQAYTSSGAAGADFTGISVLKAGRYDLNNIVSGSTDSTGTGGPNPPAVTLNGTSNVLAIGGWNMSAAATVTVGAPGNGFAMDYDIAASTRGELATAWGTNADPGGFTDNVTPNGTLAVTIGFGVSQNNSVWVGLNQGVSAGAANATAVTTSADDQWQWVVSPQLTSGAAGTHTFSIYLRADGAIVDTIAISRQSTTSPTFDDAWAYQSNPRTAQPTTCNADPVDTDLVTPGDQDGILPTGNLGMCFANKPGADDAYDMSGNVKEWTLARVAGQNPLRGGASNNTVQGTTCGLNFTLANDSFFFPNVGFRCCR